MPANPTLARALWYVPPSPDKSIASELGGEGARFYALAEYVEERERALRERIEALETALRDARDTAARGVLLDDGGSEAYVDAEQIERWTAALETRAPEKLDKTDPSRLAWGAAQGGSNE